MMDWDNTTYLTAFVAVAACCVTCIYVLCFPDEPCSNESCSDKSFSEELELFDPHWFQRFQKKARLFTSGSRNAHGKMPSLASHHHHQQFIPFACHVCKRGRLTNTKLSRCACHIRYCSSLCQKQDFNSHKAVCAALIKVRKFASMFREHVNANDYHSYQKYIECGSIYLHSSKSIDRHQLKKCINIVSVWNRQAHCMICYTTEHLKHTCKHCHGVAVCKTCYATQGLKAVVHNATDCSNWKLFTCVVGFRSTNEVRAHGDSKNSHSKLFVPSDWLDYFNHQSNSLTNHRMAPLMCVLSDGLSTPLTLLLGLRLAYKELSSMTTLAIHLVGANVEETRCLTRYLEIPHCLPRLKKMKIIMIGPNMPTDVCDTNILLTTERCCVSIDTVSSSYETYTSQQDIHIDFVMAQHSGCEDQSWGFAWEPAIKALCAMQTPCLFTGYAMQESIDGVRLFETKFQSIAKITQPATLNKFAGLTPYPDAAGAGFYNINSAYFSFIGKIKNAEIDDID
jgi:hypothetical protein